MTPTRDPVTTRAVWLLLCCGMPLILFLTGALGANAQGVVAQSMEPDAQALDAEAVDAAVTLVNQARWENGELPPLKQVGLLNLAAETHSTNMAQRDFFMHCDPDNGDLPWDRMADAGYTGYSYAAENVAAGYTTPTAVMAGWMASAGHRANILSPNVWEVGVGYYFQLSDLKNVRFDTNGDCVPDHADLGPYYHYWTMNFGRRFGAYPLVIDREAPATSGLAVSLYIYGPPSATAMRLSNDGQAWSDWEPYSAERVWTLSPGNGPKTVYSQVTDGLFTYDAEDDILLAAPEAITPEVTIEAGAIAVTLSWLHVSPNVQYDVYCSMEDPFFDLDDPFVAHIGIGLLPPGEGGPMTLVDDSLSGLGNYTYTVCAKGPDGVSNAISKRLARFSFPLIGSN